MGLGLLVFVLYFAGMICGANYESKIYKAYKPDHEYYSAVFIWFLETFFILISVLNAL